MAERRSFPLVIDKWDSGFFKKPIARLTLSGRKKDIFFSDKLSNLIAQAHRENVGYLVVKLENPRPMYENVFRGLGMTQCGESMDLKFSYGRKRNNNLFSEYDINMFEAGDIQKVRNISRDAFRRSYLYRCGFGKRSEVDRYHTVWIENLSGDKYSHIFIAKKNGVVIGFLALKLDKIKHYARIVLIAVQKKYRGKGIGRALVHRCIAWGVGRATSISVKTQKDNRAAAALYKKMVFTQTGRDKIFCKKISKQRK